MNKHIQYLSFRFEQLEALTHTHDGVIVLAKTVWEYLFSSPLGQAKGSKNNGKKKKILFTM